MGFRTEQPWADLGVRCLFGARIPGYRGTQSLQLDPGGAIQSIQPRDAALSQDGSIKGMDLGGDWLSLGGVDLQINGALGLAFPDVGLLDGSVNARLTAIGEFLWHQGIDAYMPTIVTTAADKIHSALGIFADLMADSRPVNFRAVDSQPQIAQILGVHLEGPFLNPAKRGAHPQEFLLPLNLKQVARVLGQHRSVVKVITLAPELDPRGEAISDLCAEGIIVSLGHSLATAAQARQAFDQGARMVTHAFNAMPGLHHREPGLLGAAMVDSRVWCGLIADGEHICPTMLDILLRTARSGGGFFLVSDALSPLGLPDGVYPWDSRQIEVKQGTARLLDGTLAGTTLPLLTGVKNLVDWGICELETAIALATEAPRQAIGLPGLGLGQSARNLLRWHRDKISGNLTWKRLFPG
jgi:N-acetylglucosamine-6-phosphate deacetylase